MRRRFTIETTLYGKRLVSRDQLYQLHREVARAAQLARLDDPKYVETQRTGWEISGARSGGVASMGETLRARLQHADQGLVP